MADHSPKAALRGEPGYVWRSGQDRRLAFIRRWADLSGRVLDSGCGLGTYLEAFLPYAGSRFGHDVERERLLTARTRADGLVEAIGEALPFAAGSFDFILSNEVIEHVEDDRGYLVELARVTAPGGRIVVFCPNRWYPVEQHGIYWRGAYHFGNKPLVNYLPDVLRNRLAPHVRTYTRSGLLALLEGLPVRVVHHTRIYGGYDNIEARWPTLGRVIKRALYAAERTPLRVFGISHLLVLERL
jgi:SAM-dependent methyltransferase